MTVYNIDYSEPLRTGFAISPGGFDGPGGLTSHTSLRLYGRGALEWGESVDENLVRLNENFAGATPPIVPIGGQLWLKQSLYVMNGASFFRWNIDTGVWEPLTVTTVANSISTQPPGVSIGSYVYSTPDQVLYRWDAAYKQEAATWLVRSLTTQATNPTTQKPAQSLLMYDEYTDRWITPASVVVGAGLPAVGEYDGQLYYDETTGNLYIWNARTNSWQQILGPSNTGGTSAASGDIDMQNLYSIINLVTPLSSELNNAATVEYVNDEINTALTNLSGSIGTIYVKKSGGDTMSGTYALTGSLNASATVSGLTGNFTTGNITTLNATTGNITNASITTSFNANGIRLQNVVTPSIGTDGANATYVNNARDFAINSANTTMRSEACLVNPASYKNGDIHVNPGTGKAYIYLNSGWRQIWPATYS